MEHLIFIAIFSPAICGLYIAAQPGMILYFITRLFDQLPEKIAMPFITCPTCMASVWGVTSYLFYFGNIDMMVVPCVCALAYTNSLLINIYYRIKDAE